ncbi:MAG TPA: response regulator [Polyangiaceae bacterium]|jgi:DNA-binding response OmpR family regulator
MSSRSSEEKDNAGSRLGGARADFVASLGRKVNDARELLVALEDDPSSRQARDELRRRLHALGAGARLLRFDAMTRSLQEALGVLDRGAQLGSMREQEVAFVAQVVDDLPALAWGEAPPREPTSAPPGEADDPPGVMPIAVLVVGSEALADALGEDATLRARAFESERTEDAQTALELARAYAPDVMLVDADVPQAYELVEALLDDPLTEPVPIVVVGSFPTADEAARYVALGVAKALSKPVPPEVLRRTCDDLLDAREERTVRVTLGEPTLEQLAERLSDELKRALVDSVDRTARSCRVPLGEGTEVLGALWGAIARVQEIVSQKTGGAVRFGGDAPEGTIALAPWLHQDVPAADRLVGRGRGAAADVRLQGRRVVIADDDPGVTWFIADLLRTAGCEVHEALDGLTALELAFRVQPELVVSDILMPGMDGFALSRALRRDVALRDVPVILLSWKEDLLQRVRELGASAAAYMKKESDSRSILARVREVLRPRARIELRLRGDGEVRGRLDGLTPRLLLELVGAVRKDARVGVRDATYLYEIEIRDGTPRKATRTASDGGYLSGERALASLLGVGAGRFVVSPSSEPIRGELTGTLFEQLARPVAAARGAVMACTGSRTMNIERIGLDEGALEEYLSATPDPARTIIRRLSERASPRQMLLSGEVEPALLEDVLVDLASRGAIRAVEGVDGTDLLSPAVEAALSVLQGAPRPARLSLPPNARPSALPSPTVLRPRTEPRRPAPEPAPASPLPAAYESIALSEPPPRAPPPADEEGVPSSLEDAVMREISDRSPQPGVAHVPASNPPPIVEPSALRKRSSNPPAVDDDWDTLEEQSPLASIPPDAVVPEASSAEELPVAPPAAPPVERAPLALAFAEPEVQDRTDVEAPYSSPFAVAEEPLAPEPSPLPPPDPPPPRPIEPTLPLPRHAAPAEDAPVPQPAEVPAPRRRSVLPLVAAFAGLGLAVGIVLTMRSAAPPEPVHDTPRATPSAATVTTAPSAVTATASAPAPTASALGDELPPGAEVPAGLGLVEVSAPTGSRVRIDGAIAGGGPVASLVAAPGYHEVRVEQDGHDTKQVIEVRAGKTTRVRSAPGP